MRAAGVHVRASRSRLAIALAIVGLSLLTRPASVAAQSTTEVWQAVLSIPTVSGSGLPSVPSPSPGLIYPSGIATTPSGDIVVADSGNNLVRVFDGTTYAEKLTITGGNGHNSFSWPSDVAVDACGHILVTDYGHNSLRVFSSTDGTELQSITGLSSPWGIALSSGAVVSQACTSSSGATLSVGGTVAVVNSISSGGTGGGSVNVYDGNLSYKFSIGESDGGSKLEAPLGVAIDASTGNFYVSDATTPPVIKAYDSTGAFLFSFTDSSLGFPDDLAFDSQGRLVVSDAGTQQVDFFKINYDSGTPANSTASLDFAITRDNTPGTFLAPSGVGFDAAGQLLVTTGTYDPITFEPVAATQLVLVFDRPTLAIMNVTSSAGLSAVPPGTALTFTVTAISSTGEVDNVVLSGTVTQVDGTTVSLGTVSVGTITAGTPATATFTYTVPSSVSANGSISFSAGATGQVTNGTATTDVSAPAFAATVVPVVVTGDTTAPTTTLAATPSAPQSGTWYSTAVSITLSATDNAGGSGIAEVDYQFSGPQELVDGVMHQILASSGQTTVTATTSITQDGAAPTTITYWAVDKAGNTETPHTQSFYVDRNGPYATWGAPSPSATSPAGSPVSWWNTVPVNVPFTAIDRGSGVASYTPAIGYVTFTTEGANQRQAVIITDKAGNVSDSNRAINNSPTINIDLTKPQFTSVVAAPSPNANGWNNTPVSVTFLWSDNLSGFLAADSVHGVNSDLQGQKVVTLSTDGRNQSVVSQTITDLAGNVSAPQSYSTPINIDQTPPVVTGVNYLNTNTSQIVTANGNGWFNVPVTVQLTSTDASSGSGFSTTSPVFTTTKTLSLGEGRHGASTMTVSDLAGNSSVGNVQEVDIDLTAPVITGPAFTNRTTGAVVTPHNGWYSGPINVTFTATDALSGFAGGGLQATQTYPLATDQAGQSTPASTFTDLAGNSSTANALTGLNVDSTPPMVTAAGSGTPAFTDTNVTPARVWYSAPITVTFTGTDALSGFTTGAQATATQTIGEGLDETVSQTFTDLAGNAAGAAFGPVSVDLTAPTLTPAIAVNGNTESVSFAASDAGSGLASCAVSINGVVQAQACNQPLTFSPADAGTVVAAIAIDRVGLQTSSSVTISFAPPEAYNQFDPVTHDVLVYGFDPTTGASLGVIPPVSITRTDADGLFGQDHDGHWFGPFPGDWMKRFGGPDGHGLRLYRIQGTGNNSLTLIEAVNAAGHQIGVQVIGFQYTMNGTTEPFIFAPDAIKKFEWAVNRDGSLRELNQEMSIGRGPGSVDVQAHYDSRKNQTVVRVKPDGASRPIALQGLVLLQMATNHQGGNLVIRADGLTPVPGPASRLTQSDPENVLPTFAWTPPGGAVVPSSGGGDQGSNAPSSGNSGNGQGNANGQSNANSQGNGNSQSNGNSQGNANSNNQSSGNGNDQKPASDADQNSADNHATRPAPGSKVSIKQGDAPGNWTATLGSGQQAIQITAHYDAAHDLTTITIAQGKATQELTSPGQIAPESLVDPKTGDLKIDLPADGPPPEDHPV